MQIGGGVKLIVISPPTYKNYQSMISERGLEEMMKVVKYIKNLYPTAEYKNYIFDDRFTEEDFFNSSHLSEQGAKKFSLIFKSDFLL